MNTAMLADKLSKQKVSVPALIQELFDDNGVPINAKVTMAEVPMSTIILPMAYQFSRIYFQADLKMSELDTKKGVRLVKSAAALNVKADLNLDVTTIAAGNMPGLKAGGAANISGSDSKTTQTTGRDESIAELHFEATLEPRKEIQIPAPLRSRVAPRIMIVVTTFDLTPAVAADPAANPPVVFKGEKREVTIKVTVLKANGADNTANVATKLEVSSDDPELLVTLTQGSPGIFKVARVQESANAPLPPRSAHIVRVTLGAITEQVSLSI